jgi:GlpG protein
MIEIGVITNPRMAQAFVDYLAVKKIDAKMAPTENGFAICLPTMTHVEDASHELDLFLADPYQAKYQAASWDVADTRTASFTYSSGNMVKNFLGHAGMVTLVVFVICLAVFMAMYLGMLTQNEFVFAALHFPFALSLGTIAEFWRLFTPALMHFSVLHLVFNLLWWWYLGGQIETKMGSKKLLLIFLVAALIPNVGQFLLSGPNFGGISGVVYALVGYIWWTGRLAPELGLNLPKPYVGFMLAWLVLGFFPVLGLNMANTAHLLGLLVGCGQAFIDHKFKYSN